MARTNEAGRIYAVLARSNETLEAALDRQVRQPDAVVANPPTLSVALRQAIDNGADWMWLLDGAVLPRDNALSALVGALDRIPEATPPAVLGGTVRRTCGRIDRSRPFWFRSDDVEPAVKAATTGLLPIRATSGPVLVNAAAAASTPPRAGDPFSPPVLFEWTARLLRPSVGYLVSDSEYEAVEPATDPLQDPVTVARLIFGQAFRRIDRLRVAYELVGRTASLTGGRS